MKLFVGFYLMFLAVVSVSEWYSVSYSDEIQCNLQYQSLLTWLFLRPRFCLLMLIFCPYYPILSVVIPSIWRSINIFYITLHLWQRLENRTSAGSASCRCLHTLVLFKYLRLLSTHAPDPDDVNKFFEHPTYCIPCQLPWHWQCLTMIWVS